MGVPSGEEESLEGWWPPSLKELPRSEVGGDRGSEEVAHGDMSCPLVSENKRQMPAEKLKWSEEVEMTPGDNSLRTFCHQTRRRNGAAAAYVGFFERK